MKMPKGMITGLLLLGTISAFAQADGEPGGRRGGGGFGSGAAAQSGFSGFSGRQVGPAPQMTPPSPQSTAGLTRFSLDFPGGTPRELAAAIQKASGKPLNVIVPDDA